MIPETMAPMLGMKARRPVSRPINAACRPGPFHPTELDGLRTEGLDPAPLADGTPGEHTHSAVAAHVASHMADAGFGVETSARRFGLEFIPVQTERYGLLMSASTLETKGAQRLLGMLRSPACQAAFQALEGYRPELCGKVEPACEAFRGWPV